MLPVLVISSNMAGIGVVDVHYLGTPGPNVIKMA